MHQAPRCARRFSWATRVPTKSAGCWGATHVDLGLHQSSWVCTRRRVGVGLREKGTSDVREAPALHSPLSEHKACPTACSSPAACEKKGRKKGKKQHEDGEVVRKLVVLAARVSGYTLGTCRARVNVVAKVHGVTGTGGAGCIS